MMEGQTGKVSQIRSQEDLVDRISDLPDPILSYILSYLPTKNSVATAILSQRWKFLWTDVSNFDFCNVKLDEIDDAKLVKFIEFGNNVLLHHTAGSINNFSLTYEAQSISSDVNSWINTAIANNVHNLFLIMTKTSLYFRGNALTFEPPPRIFSCESLHTLELKCRFVIRSADMVSLPRLESLKLDSIRFQDEEAFQKLLLGCPVLKCLCIYNLVVDYKNIDEYMDEEYIPFDEDLFKFMVYSTSLRHLELEVSCDIPDTCYCSLELKTPSLEVLKLKNCITRIFLQESLSSLLEVEFEINYYAISDGYDYFENSCNYVVEAVRAFSYAKHLALATRVMRALKIASIKLNIKFKRLTKFLIRGYDYTLQDIMDFIHCSDSLEHLVFEKRCYNEDICWENPDLQVPKCLTNSLKLVEFFAFQGSEDEMAMLNYLLKHGSVLSDVHIHVRVKPLKKKLEMLRQISKFSRKSPACQLHYF